MILKNSIFWKRLDKFGQESAAIFLNEGNYLLKGSSLFIHDNVPYSLLYEIKCSLEWETKAVEINGWGGNKLIKINIVVDEKGRWNFNGTEAAEVKNCIDIDLNFSPSTNLLPIRRLDIKIGESKKVNAAWLRFPSFKLEKLEQVYKKIDEETYHYESGGGKFAADLKVNKAGFVILYPDFFKSISEINI